MQALDPAHIWSLIVGVGLGVAGFAPLLTVVQMVRSGRIKPSVGKGMVALAISFIFLMTAFGAIWLLVPRDLPVVAVGFLGGFLIMWAVLAARTMSH